jgi:dolichyl-phosphate beta-glucosyltransferase
MVSNTRRVILIPYYNEMNRIDLDSILGFVSEVDCDCIFIDDGSSDGSGMFIQKYFSKKKKTSLDFNFSFFFESIATNSGKANAVRHGILVASKLGYNYALVQDFDLPYRATDGTRAFQEAEKKCQILISGARIRLAGSEVYRSSFRHWIGRIIATYIHLFAYNGIYDPQSPCKVYKVQEVLPYLHRKFETKWFGDIELLGRIGKSSNQVFEFPLESWRDMKGGKLSISKALFVVIDLIKLKKAISYGFLKNNDNI